MGQIPTSNIQREALPVNSFFLSDPKSRVHAARYKVQVFVLSAVYAAIAGSLYAHFVTFVSPSACDLHLSIMLVTMVVVGGISSLWGALLGAVLLGILPELLRSLKDYDILFYGMILLLIMMFAPEGIWGLIQGIGPRWSKGEK